MPVDPVRSGGPSLAELRSQKKWRFFSAGVNIAILAVAIATLLVVIYK